MNVASITATAISQGFFPPGAEPPLAGCGVMSFCPKPQIELIIYRCARKPWGFNDVWDDSKTVCRGFDYHG